MTKEERRLDLSGKLLKMGESLILEGRDSMDGCVMETGSALILLANIIESEDDMFVFGEFVSMFSAKKVLEEMENKKKPNTTEDLLKEILDSFKNVGSDLPKETPKKTRRPRKKRNDNDEPESGS